MTPSRGIYTKRMSEKWSLAREETLRTMFLDYALWADVVAAINALPGPELDYPTIRRHVLHRMGLTRERRETARIAAPNWSAYQPVKLANPPKPRGVLNLMDIEAARREREAFVIPITWDGVIDWCYNFKPKPWPIGMDARELLASINRYRMSDGIGLPPWTVIDWHEAVKWEAVHWGKRAA